MLDAMPTVSPPSMSKRPALLNHLHRGHLLNSLTGRRTLCPLDTRWTSASVYSRPSGAWLGDIFADWQALLQETFPVITDAPWVATTKPLAWQSGVSEWAGGGAQCGSKVVRVPPRRAEGHRLCLP